ncbi:protein of unknown function [Paenibacillus sp. yr247]|uniref:ImmA/IrrE family metallo-endopeptidase n=1 Tax=Paenibacillus sp. yr247 TaxID=1761880 RepID=UPI000890C3E9|nr:ImmA/IrrE family metallo-endopeptidase [Paenibacillus sp. yr247]SDP02416.1 protein of unknown function [Paenibacillus sp. yr247]
MEILNQSQAEQTANLAVARNAARKIHKDLKLTFPVPIRELLIETYGFTILDIEIDEEISALVDLDSKYIGLNNGHHINRQRFTLAHELGHIILNHKDVRYTDHENSDKGKAPFEKEADEFAAELLMPQHELKRVKSKDIADLLAHFHVSKQALFNQLMKYKFI